MNSNRPSRKPLRLKEYDYALPGVYFVTICTKDRKCMLSSVCEQAPADPSVPVGQGFTPAAVKLSPLGRIAEDQLHKLGKRYTNVSIDKYVIMPNHIHILISLKYETAGASPCPTISEIICSFKSLTTLAYGKGRIFQSSFHDHIVRDQEDYANIWEYIDTNPLKWQLDKYYSLQQR